MKPLVIPENVEKLSVVSYHINSGYKENVGLSQHKSNKFYQELIDTIYPPFKEKGWKWLEPVVYGDYPQIVNQEDMHKRIYLNPLRLSMCADEDNQKILRNLLEKNNFKTFQFEQAFVSEIPYYNCTCEEVEKIYRDNKNIIKENIVERIALGASSQHIFYSEITNFNQIRSTGEENFDDFRLSNTVFSNVFSDCLQELQDERKIEKDSSMFTLCSPHKEPYITINTVSIKLPNRKLSFYRLIATVKTKDCVPVASLYFYPDGADLKGIHRLNSEGIIQEINFFVKANKNTIQKLGELVDNKEQFGVKQKEFVAKWKDHYLNNTLSFSR